MNVLQTRVQLFKFITEKLHATVQKNGMSSTVKILAYCSWLVQLGIKTILHLAIKHTHGIADVQIWVLELLTAKIKTTKIQKP